MKKILHTTLITIGVLLSSIVMPCVAMAATTSSGDAICEGAGISCTLAEAGRVNTAVQTAVRIFQVIVGVVAIFYIIYAGLRFITSSGGSDGVKTARNSILYASVGLVVVLIAEGIIRFVLSRFTS